MSDTSHDEPTPPNPVAKEPAEGGEVPDAGPGAERAHTAEAGTGA